MGSAYHGPRPGATLWPRISCGRKNLPQAAALAGFRRRGVGEKPLFYRVFHHGTALAEELAEMLRARWSFCDVACLRRRLDRDRCPVGADVDEIGAIDGIGPG